MKQSPSSLVLVRVGPKSEQSGFLLEWLKLRKELKESGLVFFQGEGVSHALSDWPLQATPQHWRYLLCRGSWQRRSADRPPQPFETGSLTTFFDALDGQQTRLVNFGLGGHA